MEESIKATYISRVAEEPFARLLRIALKDVNEGYALCEMEYREELDNLYGMMHGGAIFSLI
ncbi:MAG: thioesterase, partial [Candidatus Bathyarchaeia archaeon]